MGQKEKNKIKKGKKYSELGEIKDLSQRNMPYILVPRIGSQATLDHCQQYFCKNHSKVSDLSHLHLIVMAAKTIVSAPYLSVVLVSDLSKVLTVLMNRTLLHGDWTGERLTEAFT